MTLLSSSIVPATPVELIWTAGDKPGVYLAEGCVRSYRISRDPELKEYILSVKPHAAEGESSFSPILYAEPHAKAGQKQSWFVLNGCKAKAQSLEGKLSGPATPKTPKAASVKAPKINPANLDLLDDLALETILTVLNAFPKTKRAGVAFDHTLALIEGEKALRIAREEEEAAASRRAEIEKGLKEVDEMIAQVESETTPSDEQTPEAREEGDEPTSTTED